MFGDKKQVAKGPVGENDRNVIEKGTVLVGNITTTGNLRVNGKIVGTVSCNSKLVLGPGGFIEGSIDARNASIDGEVIGTVIVRELLELKQKAKINGNISTSKLAMEVGALFTGNCKMSNDAKSQLERPIANVDMVFKEASKKPGRNNGSKMESLKTTTPEGNFKK